MEASEVIEVEVIHKASLDHVDSIIIGASVLHEVETVTRIRTVFVEVMDTEVSEVDNKGVEITIRERHANVMYVTSSDMYPHNATRTQKAQTIEAELEDLHEVEAASEVHQEEEVVTRMIRTAISKAVENADKQTTMTMTVL